MRRFTLFSSLALLLIGSAIGIGCSQSDAPTNPSESLERTVVSIGDGNTRPTELPTQCAATPLAALARDEVMVVDLVYGLSSALSDRSDVQRAELGSVEADLQVAAKALASDRGDVAIARLRAVAETFQSLAERSSEHIDPVWARTVAARLNFLLDRPKEELLHGRVSYEEFNRVARDASGSEGFLARGGCFQDCLREELEECADNLIDNIGGPSAGGIIENLIDDCIAGGLAGCAVTAWSGPGCLIGALEGCLLGISADYIWQVSKFLCCVGGSFASCAWDCLW